MRATDKRTRPDPVSPQPTQEGTRRLILDQTARLFCARGYASTSLRDIAAAAGMKAGSLYYHFESKEDLAEVVLSEGVAVVEARVTAAIDAAPEGSDALALIRLAMVAHLQALHEKGDYASANILCYGHVPSDIKTRLRKVRARYEEVWSGMIRRAHEAGQLKAGTDLVALRYALVGMLNGTLEWRRARGLAPVALAEAFLQIAFEGARDGG